MNEHDYQAAEAEEKTKALLVESVQAQAGVHLLALVGIASLSFLPSWARFVAGFLAAGCLLGALSTRSKLKTIASAERFYGSVGTVIRNHLKFNLLALAANTYAFIAIWSSWPVPWLAVLLSLVITFVHFAGYKNSVRQPKQGDA